MCSIRQTVAPLVQELVVDGEEDDKTYLFKKKSAFRFERCNQKRDEWNLIARVWRNKKKRRETTTTLTGSGVNSSQIPGFFLFQRPFIDLFGEMVYSGGKKWAEQTWQHCQRSFIDMFGEMVHLGRVWETKLSIKLNFCPFSFIIIESQKSGIFFVILASDIWTCRVNLQISIRTKSSWPLFFFFFPHLTSIRKAA